jgi:site-specific recombinase XerD
MKLFDLLPQLEIDSIPQIPLGETPIWGHWFEFVWKYLRTGKSEATVKNVKDVLKFVIRKLKIYTIEQLNRPKLIEDLLFEYKKEHGISPNTFNSYRKNINTFCIWLEKMEYIASNNVRKIDKCKPSYDENLTLSQDQINAVVVQIRDRRQLKLERLRNAFFIDLLRFTGARPSELMSLEVKDITKSKDGYVLCIQGRKQKGRKRFYELRSYVIDSFEAYMAYRVIHRPNEEYLFASSYKRMAWTYVGMKNLFQKLSKELGFHVNAYSFRRYVATHLNSKKMPVENIRDYLGHTRSTTTLRYIERSCVLTKDCTEAMAAN